MTPSQVIDRVAKDVTSGRFLLWCPLLVVIHVLGYANWVYGPLRFTSPLANHLLMFLVFGLPLVLLVLVCGIRRLAVRLGACVILLPWVLWCSLCQMVTTLSTRDIIRNGADSSFEYLRSTSLGRSRVSVYRTNGGATTDWGVTYRHELTFFPGIQIVRELEGFYHCYDGSAERAGDLAVHVSCTQSTETNGRVPPRPTRIELRPHVLF